MDYLLKPFDNARFFRVLARRNLAGAAGRTVRRFERIMVCSGCVSFLRAEEIDWIVAADYYSCLHIGAKTHLLRRSMAELERDLEAGALRRIHRSTIVNLERVRDLCLDASGEYEVVLRDETWLAVNTRISRKSQLAVRTTPCASRSPKLCREWSSRAGHSS